MTNEKRIYEKTYFDTYYSKNLKELTQQDVKKIKNWFWGWFKYLNKFASLQEGRNRRVLEIGCALGVFSSLLKERGFDVSASDISPYIINFARQLFSGIKFYNFDVQREIPLDGLFDFICSFEVLEHLADPLAALKNIYAKLSLNGVMVCSTPPPDKKYMNITGHVNLKSAQQWQEILLRAGFQKDKIKIKQVSFLPFLYRYSKILSLAIPLKINFPYFNSTYFLIAYK